MSTHPYDEHIRRAIIHLWDLPVDVEVRVTKECAKVLLLCNFTVGDNDGIRHYINIRDLGLGVCAISKAPTNQHETKMIKKQPARSANRK